MPAGFADSVTIAPEADTFVRIGDAVAHGADTTFDVHGGASSYGCGTGPAFGLLRFDLDAIPAGATVTSATLELTSLSGFAFDGDPVPPGALPLRRQLERGVGGLAGACERRDARSPRPADVDDLRRAVRHVAERARRRRRLHRCRLRRVRERRPQLQHRWLCQPRVPDHRRTSRGHEAVTADPFEALRNALHRSCVRTGNWSRPTSFATPPRKAASRRRRGSTSTYTPGVASAPTLVRAVPTGGNTTVVGRVDGGGAADLTFLSSPTCVDGVLGGTPTTIGASRASPPDANGYFSAVVGNVTDPELRRGASAPARPTSRRASSPRRRTTVADGVRAHGRGHADDAGRDRRGRPVEVVRVRHPARERGAGEHLEPAGGLRPRALQGHHAGVHGPHLAAGSDAPLRRVRAEHLLAEHLQPVDLLAEHLQPRRLRAVDLLAQHLQSVDLQPVDLQPVDLQPVDLLAEHLLAEHLQPVDLLAEHLQPVDLLARASSARASSARTPLQAPRRGASSPPRRHPARPTSSSSRTRGATRAGTTCGSRAAPARSAPTARTR